MMPIVDAGVGLSQNNFAVGDYLSAIKQFHALRMVVVQRPQSDESALQELHYFQAQATTRGSGGFPNAIIARADLLNPLAITELVKLDTLKNLRGVCYRIEEPLTSTARIDWQQSLTVLAQKCWCLDLSISETDVGVVDDMANFQAELTIVVDISSINTDENKTQALELKRFARLACNNNVYLKLTGNASSNFNVYSAKSTFIDEALDIFGPEKIMFASGTSRCDANGTIDHLWSQYAHACSNISARYRDKLFRTNAIRVYKL